MARWRSRWAFARCRLWRGHGADADQLLPARGRDALARVSAAGACSQAAAIRAAPLRRRIRGMRKPRHAHEHYMT